MITGSSFGDHQLVINGNNALFPYKKNIEKILNYKISLYANISTSCTSALNAIGYGYNLISQGQIEHAIVGGCEALDDYIMTGMDVLRVLSAKRKSTPFSALRDGTTLGEGAAFFILKNLENAIKNKDKIFAEIINYANTNDAHDITKPDMTGWGLITTMKECCKNRA